MRYSYVQNQFRQKYFRKYQNHGYISEYNDKNLVQKICGFIISFFLLGKLINKAPSFLPALITTLLWYYWLPYGVSRIVIIFIILVLGLLAIKMYRAEDDFKWITIDEVLGVSVTIFFLPHILFWYVLGFALFGFLDKWKPWPCSRIDETWGPPWGVMMDDLFAALYAGIFLSLVYYSLFA